MVSETANIKSEPNACLWVQMNFSIELVHSFVSINRLSSIHNWFDFVFADLMAGWRIYSSMIWHIFSSGDGLSSPIAKLLPEPTLSCHQNCLGCSYFISTVASSMSFGFSGYHQQCIIWFHSCVYVIMQYFVILDCTLLENKVITATTTNVTLDEFRNKI